MALVFVDNPSAYGAAAMNQWWFGGTQNVTIQNSVLPPGAQPGASTLTTVGAGGGQRQVLSNVYSAVSRRIFGLRFYRIPTGSGGVGGYVLQACKNQGLGHVNPCCGVRVDDTGTTVTDGLINNGNPNVLGTGPVIPSGTWHHLEIDITCSTTGTGSVTIYLDGNPTPFMHLTGLTMQYATQDCWTYWCSALINPPDDSSLTQGFSGHLCDGYVFDASGSAPFNAPLATQGLGAPKTGFALPNGAGHVTNWAPNGAANVWQCISEVPEDGDATFASDSTVGDKYFCTIGTIPAIQTLIGAQLATCAREDDAGPRAIQSGFSNGVTDGFSGNNQYMGGAYQYFFDEFMVNPVTGLPWSAGDLATLQIGAKVTV